MFSLKSFFIYLNWLHLCIIIEAKTAIEHPNKTELKSSNNFVDDVNIEICSNLTKDLLKELKEINNGLENLRNDLKIQKTVVFEISKIQSEMKETLAQLKRFVENNTLYKNNTEKQKTEITKIICSEHTQPTNCAEAMCSSFTKDGIYQLHVPDSELKPFQTYCQRHNNTGWTIIQRRQDGSVNFDRNLNSYKNGFGDASGEYWLGLERLHAMTRSQDYELWIQLESYAQGIRNLYYKKFSVGSKSEDYKLTIKNIDGVNTNDSLSFPDEVKFSTFDRDLNLDKRNCAQIENGGWWFKNCHSNLNGNYFSYNNRMTKGGIYWYDWLRYESLRYTHMAIRPKSSIS